MRSILLGWFCVAMVACQPSIYGRWRLTDVKMEATDSVAIAELLGNGSITYTFSRNGSYTYLMAGDTGRGSFEIISKKAPMQLKTKEGGSNELLFFDVTRNNLIFRDKEDEMTFERIKKEK